MTILYIIFGLISLYHLAMGIYDYGYSKGIEWDKTKETKEILRPSNYDRYKDNCYICNAPPSSGCWHKGYIIYK